MQAEMFYCILKIYGGYVLPLLCMLSTMFLPRNSCNHFQIKALMNKNEQLKSFDWQAKCMEATNQDRTNNKFEGLKV